MRRTIAVTVGLGLWLVVAAHALHAGERTHEVRPGESVSSIAKRYYGSYDASDLLLRYNGKSGNVIRPGDRLKIPYAETHVVRAGDSWSVLARRYLGRSAAYPTIAALNELSPGDPLRVGQRLEMPFVLEHRLARGETLASLAERFYGDARAGQLLSDFNRIDDPRRLSVGVTIGVPLISPRLRSAPPGRDREVADKAPRDPGRPAATASRREAASAAPDPPAEPVPTAPAPRFADELAPAGHALSAGDYQAARRLLESLQRRVEAEGTPADRAELWRLLAFTYVAFDLQEETCDAYRRLRAVSPTLELDADRVSPRIRDAFAECAGDRPA